MTAIKWHGGKTYLAGWIISKMPPRCKNPNAPAPDDPGWLHYVEPYFGGGAVLFANDPEGISEVVNDLNGELTNFWDVLKSEVRYQSFARLMHITPCSQVEFNRAVSQQEANEQLASDPVERAAAFFVRNRQSRQALGRDFCTLARNRTRRGMNEFPSAWLSAIEGLPEVHQRLQRVVILESQDACKVIRQQDGPRTLFYLDPPYLHETRSTTGEYSHEMSVQDHRDLLEALLGVRGRFMLSGYHSALYNDYASRGNWTVHEFKIPNQASGAKKKELKTEVLWCNF